MWARVMGLRLGMIVVGLGLLGEMMGPRRRGKEFGEVMGIEVKKRGI